MYSYNSYGRFPVGSTSAVLLLFCFVLSIIAGIVLYFTFLSKKNEGRHTGFVAWLYDFLNFKKLIIEAILKIFYLILAVFMTVGGFILLFSSFLAGLFMMVLGNVIVRIAYEFSLILVLICKNTSDINQKLSGKDSSDNKNLFVSEVALPKKIENALNSLSVPKPEAEENKKGEFCPKCGTKVDASQVFCSSCGNKL